MTTPRRWKRVASLALALSLLAIGGAALYVAWGRLRFAPPAVQHVTFAPPTVQHVKDRLARLRVGMTKHEVATALESDRMQELSHPRGQGLMSTELEEGLYELSPHHTLCLEYRGNPLRLRWWELRAHPKGHRPLLPLQTP